MTNGESTASAVTQLKESNLSFIAANPPSPDEYFEFKTNRAKTIFDYLVKSFSQDYMTKRLARDDSGWRSLGEVVQDLKISTSIVYSKKRNQFSPPVQELLSRGFVERRFFQGKRGRGGEIMRLRIAYENDMIKEYVERKIRLGSSVRNLEASPNHLRPVEKLLTTKINFHRIAILPFANISPDPKDEYFADGMTEELISTISKISGLSVIARTSVMAYKDREKRIDEIARELKVGTILEGSVRKAGDRLRITVQLIDSQNGDHLWSDNYDRELKDVFAIQSEIAQIVARALKVQLIPQEKERIQKQPTADAEAHTLYLKAIFHMYRGDERNIGEAIVYLEQAVDRDPSYVLAYTALMESYGNLYFFDMLPAKDAIPKMERFARKALEIDDSLPEAHVSKGLMFFCKWDFAEAEVEIKHALKLNPNLVTGHWGLGTLFFFMRRFDEAILEFECALQLDPLSVQVISEAATCYLYSGRFDDAIVLFRKMIQLDSRNPFAWANLGNAYVQKGMVELGLQEIRKSVEMAQGDNLGALNDLAYALVKAGKIEEVRKILSDMLVLWDHKRGSATVIAGIYSNLGELDKAFEWLEKAYQDHSGYILGINTDFTFENLHSDPRFQALLKKIGFPDAN